MEYNEILTAARGVMTLCRACPICNGRACGNDMPGPGCKAPGNAATRNYDKWQEICVNMDTLYESRPIDTSLALFGRSFTAPIFAAPLGALAMHYGDKYNDLSYNSVLVPVCAEYGIAAFTGDGVDPAVMKSAVEVMEGVGGVGIPTIKPWNKEAVFEKLDFIKARGGVFAVAMDIDGAGLPFLKAMNPNAGSKSVAEMREIVEYALEALHMKDRSRVLMVGDRDNDVLGARLSGLDCCGVLYGYGSREELEGCHPKYLIESPRDLTGLV